MTLLLLVEKSMWREACETGHPQAWGSLHCTDQNRTGEISLLRQEGGGRPEACAYAEGPEETGAFKFPVWLFFLIPDPIPGLSLMFLFYAPSYMEAPPHFGVNQILCPPLLVEAHWHISQSQVLWVYAPNTDLPWFMMVLQTDELMISWKCI